MAQLSSLTQLKVNSIVQRAAEAEANGEPIPESSIQLRNADGSLGPVMTASDLLAAARNPTSGGPNLVRGNLADGYQRNSGRQPGRPESKKTHILNAVVILVVVIAVIVIVVRK